MAEDLTKLAAWMATEAVAQKHREDEASDDTQVAYHQGMKDAYRAALTKIGDLAAESED